MIQRPSLHSAMSPIRAHLARVAVVRQRVDRGRLDDDLGAAAVGRQLLALAQQPAHLRVLAARDRLQHVRVDAVGPRPVRSRAPQRGEDALHRRASPAKYEASRLAR